MAIITNLSQLDQNGVYSYADYLSWKFDQALEVIKGKIFPMSAPSRTHQKISWKLTLVFGEFMKGHHCDAYAAPFDVRLYDRAKSIRADEDIYTVVQPDLCIVCDLDKLDERGCLGAPDLMVEILSPGNAKREMKIKRELYAESGVQEYWVVDPARETLTRCNLDNESGYDRPLIFVSDELVTSAVFPDLVLDLKELFAGIKD
jgi:Uma2 family endonuclease